MKAYDDSLWKKSLWNHFKNREQKPEKLQTSSLNYQPQNRDNYFVMREVISPPKDIDSLFVGRNGELKKHNEI